MSFGRPRRNSIRMFAPMEHFAPMEDVVEAIEDDPMVEPNWQLMDDEQIVQNDPYDWDFCYRECRPSWYSTKYRELFAIQFDGMHLPCGICGHAIQLTVNSPMGLEVYAGFPYSHHDFDYHNQTKPHIDHHNPEWAERKRIVDSLHLTELERHEELRRQFNMDELRIVHKFCNLNKALMMGA